jgi:hypothetical protein
LQMPTNQSNKKLFEICNQLMDYLE